MPKKINRLNRKKPVTANRKIVTLALVLLFIAGTFLLLEWVKDRTSLIDKENSAASEERHKIPSRQTYAHIEMQPYTTSLPEHKHQRKLKQVSPGTVAIIIDDMGTTLQEAKDLMAINVPLTFSLIPGLPKVSEVSNLARNRGYQTMIHIPMEPKGYPKQRLEENGLLVSQADEEIVKRVNGYFKQVPNATGANNHMGSRFSENEQKMKVVLNQLKARGLFFVDSRTSPDSVGFSLARSMEIDSASRNVFLDNLKDMESIRLQLYQLADLSRKKGSAIGICHPHKVTIQALSEYLPRMQKEGITFVPAGDLVR